MTVPMRHAEITPSPVRFANHLSLTKWGRGGEPPGVAFGKPEDRLREPARRCLRLPSIMEV